MRPSAETSGRAAEISGASTLPVANQKFAETGRASWYGPGFHGRKAASGQRFDQNAMTAAHKTLPFGTRIQVTNLDNGRTVQLTVNDRGPFIRGRVLDVSKGAAVVLGMINNGTAKVGIKIVNAALPAAVVALAPFQGTSSAPVSSTLMAYH